MSKINDKEIMNGWLNEWQKKEKSVNEYKYGENYLINDTLLLILWILWNEMNVDVLTIY